MKKLALIFGLLGLFTTFNSEAQSAVASRWDSAAWDNANIVSSLIGYDIAFTTSSTTAANLGSGTTISNAISTFRVLGGANTQTVLTNLIPAAQIIGTYNIFFRAADTNNLYSAWSSPLSINFIINPSAPTNVRIIRLP